jgi:hypothetical protein
MKPTHLAEEVLKIVGDADASTALTALQIARLLILHREEAADNFQSECRTNASENRCAGA